jgi:glycosyltransferase involved in cell wall biosynthesis
VASKTISAVIPVFNSEGSLELLTKRLCQILEKQCEKFEIVFVNDGSRDTSWQVIGRLAGTYPCIHGINFMRNYGQHNALLAGIRTAKYDTIVTLDDDLQHSPEEIPRLLDKLDEGYDVVYGSPEEEKQSFSRNLASQMTKLAMQSIMKVEIARKVSAFRVFRTVLRKAFENYNASHPSIDVLLTWATTRFSYVDVRFQKRQIGQSNYTFFKLLNHAMTMATGYSTMPLRFASILGFTFTVFGLFLLVYILTQYFLHGSPVAGFPFLASTIAIFAGVQLFALGIMGEYLARMFARLMDRPGYVIHEII